jgi:hypothetical protein
MKKVLLILVLTISIQTMNAHPNTTSHAHETLLHEWAWILLPAIAIIGLVWKLSKESYSKRYKIKKE